MTDILSNALLSRKKLSKPKRKVKTLIKPQSPAGPSSIEEDTTNLEDVLFDQLSAKTEAQLTLKDAEKAPDPSTGSKRNRIKEKLRKREEAIQQIKQQAQNEAVHMPDHAKQESDTMNNICQRLNVQMVQMPSDGNCLYAAVAHQLSMTWPSLRSLTIQNLRTTTASYIRSHKDDFIFFLTPEENPEETMDDAKFEKYCDDIQNTSEWGAQILAMSKSYETPIEVLQADGPPVKVGLEEFPDAKPLRISYHKHQFASGEHYNSVIDAVISPSS